MNFSRKELIQTDATMNQMRNAIYILIRLLDKNGISDSKDNLRRMGQNIAKTYINYWKPTNIVTINNIKDVISTIYQKVLNSVVSLDINESQREIKVQDYKCALCKYHYSDVEIAGCEILLGFVSEFISLINKESYEPSSINLTPYKVYESKAYGDKSCIQIFKYKIRSEG
ncbi:MAG: hypothetical protein ACFFCV_18270 [Promethearchaeota archaeon]